MTMEPGNLSQCIYVLPNTRKGLDAIIQNSMQRYATTTRKEKLHSMTITVLCKKVCWIVAKETYSLIAFDKNHFVEKGTGDSKS